VSLLCSAFVIETFSFLCPGSDLLSYLQLDVWQFVGEMKLEKGLQFY